MIYLILNLLRDLLRPRIGLPLQNVALRQQINVLRRDNPRPAFSRWDRAFWVVLLRTWQKLSLDRRRIVHINATTNPTADWTALQLIQAFPFDTAPRFIIRDRDQIYGEKVQEAIRAIGSREPVIAARSPWQNGYCERMVGTLKRECLNHMIVLNKAHARRGLKSYHEYYHDARTHLGLEKDTPSGRPVEPPEAGPVKRRPMVGGLHSRYYRDAA